MLGAASQDEDESLKPRNYILDLSLIAMTVPQESFLRKGCQLVRESDRMAAWKIVDQDDHRDPLVLAHTEALAYAEARAEAFGVSEGKKADFNSDLARRELLKNKDECKASRRCDRSPEERGET